MVEISLGSEWGWGVNHVTAAGARVRLPIKPAAASSRRGSPRFSPGCSLFLVFFCRVAIICLRSQLPPPFRLSAEVDQDGLDLRREGDGQNLAAQEKRQPGQHVLCSTGLSMQLFEAAAALATCLFVGWRWALVTGASKRTVSRRSGKLLVEA